MIVELSDVKIDMNDEGSDCLFDKKSSILVGINNEEDLNDAQSDTSVISVIRVDDDEKGEEK